MEKERRGRERCIHTASIDSAASSVAICFSKQAVMVIAATAAAAPVEWKEREGKCACTVMRMMGVIDFSWR